MAMVIVMKNMRFVSILSAIALLYFPTFNSVSVSADTVPIDSSSTSTLVNPTPRVPSANSYLTVDLLPRRGLAWPMCSFSLHRYCYEKITKIDVAGNETPATELLNTYCHNNDMTSTELCSMDGSDWLDVSLNPLNGAHAIIDLQTTFRWKIRTGKFSPDIMMLGDTQKTIVGGNASDGWTLEVWAKPALKAYLEGCHSATTCPETSVARNYSVSISGYVRMLGIQELASQIRWPSVATEELRSALRGTFISTNGMSQQWAFAADTFSVTAVSPHFLPPDSTGKSEVTPGYVRVFLPEAYIIRDRGYENLSLVTPDRVKLTVSGANATAKVTKVDGGILVDTGVEHFSAPNPEMTILKAGTASAPAVLAKAPAVVMSSLKKGKSKALSSIARTKASQKPKWSASGKCKISGSKVVALKKAGTCKVTLRVLNAKKKYVVKATKTFKVS